MAKHAALSNDSMKTAIRLGLICAACLVFTVGGARAQNAFDRTAAAIVENEAVRAGEIWSGASYRRAAELFRRAAQMRVAGGARVKAAESLREAARFNFLLADHDAARRDLRRAARIAAEENDRAAEAVALGRLSVVHLHRGDVAQSENFYRRALAASAQTDDPAARAEALYSAAEFHLNQTYSPKTVEFYEEAFVHAERAADASLTARILHGLSYAHLKAGEPAAGLAAAERSVLKCAEIDDRRGAAIANIAVGLAHKTLGAGEKSLAAYRAAEAAFPTDTDLIEHARLLIGIAAVHSSYHETGALETILLDARRLYRTADYLPGQLAVLPSLMKTALGKGDRAAALEFRREARVLSAKLNTENYLGYAEEIFGSERLAAGATDEAVAHYRRAWGIFERAGNRPGAALINQKLGEAFENRADDRAAEENFNLALGFYRSIKNRFAVAETLYRLARLKSRQNFTDEALRLVEESLAVTENLRLEVGNAKLRESFSSNIHDRYALAIALLMRKHRTDPAAGYAVRALETAERARARQTLENLSIAGFDFVKDADPEIVRREKEIQTALSYKINRLTDLLNARADQTVAERLDAEINELELELGRLKAALRQTSPLYSAIVNPAPFDAARFQTEVLDDATVLLEFFVGEEESYLWVVGRANVSAYVLPPGSAIERRLAALRQTFDARELRTGETVADYQARVHHAEAVYADEARLLSGELFGQAAAELVGKRLLIVPDGKLQSFPVAALPFPGAVDDAPVLLTNETVYEPSAATLQVLTEKTPRRAAAKNLLVFSDPIFSADDARVNIADADDRSFGTDGRRAADAFDFARSLGALQRLDASSDEGAAIQRIVGAANVTALSGAAATREQALEASADYRAVHFAAHGLFDEMRPELAGIVLSQFDETGRRRDGVLRLEDIYRMNLSADAVILNACGTGVGAEIKGEGLKSLNNAFLQTGARSVVSSLWKIDDYAARELMENFYRELTSGTPTVSEALRRAQIGLRRNPRYQSAFYWAAFTAHGDFRAAPRLSGGAGFFERPLVVVLSGVFLLFTGALLAVRFRRRRLFDRKIVNGN